MTDPYRIDVARTTPRTPQAPPHTAGSDSRPPSGAPDHRPLRTLLWVVLAVSAAANGLTSFGAFPVALSLGFGLVGLASIAGLAVSYLRRR